MLQIFRVVLLAASCLAGVGCSSIATSEQNGVFLRKGMLPLLLSLMPAAVSGGGDDGEDIAPVDEMVKGLDTDGDGLVSLEELFPEGAEEDEAEKNSIKKGFVVADADKDGKLSVAEFSTLIKQLQKDPEAVQELKADQEL